jgi:hypothetical protein
METTDASGSVARPESADALGADTTARSTAASSQPLGPDAATILATEHWSLLGTRSLLWNERMSRTAIFLTVLSAAIVALALVANATGFGPTTRTVALVLLPVVLLLGLATYVRLVAIGNEDLGLVLAMNRLRHGYLTIAPGLKPYFSTGHHDDPWGLAVTFQVATPRDLHPWVHFSTTTPTIVATVDAAIASAIAVLLMQAAAAPSVAVVTTGAVTFAFVWGALFSLHVWTLRVLRATEPRFPTPTPDP